MSHPFTLEYMIDGEIEYNKHLQELQKSNQAKNNTHESISMQSDVSVETQIQQDAEVTEVERANQHDENDDFLNAIAEANDISKLKMSDEKRIGFCSIFPLALRRRFSAFAQEASIAFLSHLVTPSPSTIGTVGRKTLWTFLLLFGTAFMTFQFYDRISFYLSWPTVTHYQVAYSRSLRFPSVTICPEIRVSRKRVETIFGADAAEAMAQAWPPFPDVDLHPDYRSLNTSHLDIDWRKAYWSFTPTSDESIIKCEFNQLPCDLTKDLVSNGFEARMCYTINTENSSFYTTHPGANNGLRLVLYTNQSDALIAASPAAGFRVLLHDPGEIPPVNALGFRASPGKSVAVSIEFRSVSQLPAPYGECRDEKGYTQMGCIPKYRHKYILDTCNCTSDFSAPEPICNPEQIGDCALKAGDLFISTGASRRCDCPLQCNQRSYPYTVSYSPLSQLFLNRTSKQLDFRGRNINMSRIAKEIVFLDIFYSKLSYVNILTKPAYNGLKLFADLGGALGLILGGTVLTVFEVFEFIFDLMKDYVESLRFIRMLRS